MKKSHGLILTAGLLGLGAAAAAGAWVIRNSRLVGEKAAYAVLLSDGPFELRNYETLSLVGTDGSDDDHSFLRLFGYISGENEDQQKIPMTTPVLVQARQGSRRMNFIMPRSVAEIGAPRARSGDLDASTFRSGRFAVFRYRGFSDLSREAAAVTRLRGWMRYQEVLPTEGPIFALYDPPWIPGFLRRNEVLFRIEAA